MFLILKWRDNFKWKESFIYFTLGFLLVFIFSYYIRFLISETDSLAYHFFLHLPHVSPKKGDLTMVESDWYQKKIVKKIIGISGDCIHIKPSGEVFVNQEKIGFPKKIAADGRNLKPINPQQIPAGYVFLHSNHPSSFDSRYQELGLIPVSSLQGLVIPLR